MRSEIAILAPCGQRLRGAPNDGRCRGNESGSPATPGTKAVPEALAADPRHLARRHQALFADPGREPREPARRPVNPVLQPPELGRPDLPLRGGPGAATRVLLRSRAGRHEG